MVTINLFSLSSLTNISQVSSMLNTSSKQLKYLLYGRPESQRYTTFRIPKRRGGHRSISVPKDDLKSLQRRFVDILYSIYSPRRLVHGFVQGRNILTNASPHVRKRYVFNVDLENFFPSINFGRVRGLFMSEPFNVLQAGATILAQLCCHRGFLPQGAPTSPVISNIICSRLDRQLMKLAQSHNCFCTRYADDITFSKTRTAFPAEIGYFDENKNAVVGAELRQIIESNGFRINAEKVRLYTNTHRQSVTGLTVNEKPNIPRDFIRQIRAMIHAWDKYGLQEASREHEARYYRRHGKQGDVPTLRYIIPGKLAFIKMIRSVNDPVYRNLQAQFVKVYPDYFKVMLKENEQMTQRDVFISHASEDKESIARPLAEALILAGFLVWFDEYELRIGDSLRGKIDEGLASARYG